MENQEFCYEIFNKETKAVTRANFTETSGDGPDAYVIFTLKNGEAVKFANPNHDGHAVVENEMFIVRQVGTHLEADGVGVVEFPTDLI